MLELWVQKEGCLYDGMVTLSSLLKVILDSILMQLFTTWTVVRIRGSRVFMKASWSAKEGFLGIYYDN